MFYHPIKSLWMSKQLEVSVEIDNCFFIAMNWWGRKFYFFDLRTKHLSVSFSCERDLIHLCIKVDISFQLLFFSASLSLHSALRSTWIQRQFLCTIGQILFFICAYHGCAVDCWQCVWELVRLKVSYIWTEVLFWLQAFFSHSPCQACCHPNPCLRCSNTWPISSNPDLGMSSNWRSSGWLTLPWWTCHALRLLHSVKVWVCNTGMTTKKPVDGFFRMQLT